MGYSMIFAAIPGFFLSSFFLMVLWGVIAPDLSIQTVGYGQAMLITLIIWLTVAPLAAAAAKKLPDVKPARKRSESQAEQQENP